MGLFDFLGVGKAAGQAVGEISDAGVRLVNAVKGKDPELEREVVQFFGKVNGAQARINEENAKLGRGNWRSFVGWVGGWALLTHYVILPVLTWLLKIFEIATELPKLDLSELIALLVLLLGGAGIKVAEKKVMQ